MVISLKKHIESNRDELLRTALDSYRAAVEAMGTSGLQICPPVSTTLRESLWNLQQNLLIGNVTCSLLRETEQQVDAELRQWGEDVSEYFKGKTSEFKEILIVMARTAEAVGERDQKYANQFQEFTTRIEAIADLHDLSDIRESIIRGAGELRDYARKMVEESRQSVVQLRQQVDSYQTRLDDAEKLAALDPLTGLDNRRNVVVAIERRMERGAFCVMVIDLNGFKQVNDTYGHLAGDDLLKQFAEELKATFRAKDVVGRWGGDEFIVVLDGDLDHATRYVERVRKWVFGDYTMKADGQPRKLVVTAAIGTTSWTANDTVATLLDRADKSMYEEKLTASRSRRP